jgi:hypothetical protein
MIQSLGAVIFAAISVSIYSLAFHSIERYLVLRSFTFSVKKMKPFSVISISIIWLFFIGIAVILIHQKAFFRHSLGLFVLGASGKAQGFSMLS